MQQSLEVRPFRKPGHVLSLDGRILAIPSGWELLPPGDAALSRRLKAAGPSWTVKEKVGNKLFSRGIWAPSENISALRFEREGEKEDPAYQKRLEAGRRRRAVEQAEYVEDFRAAVLDYLAFDPAHSALAEELASRITVHATPVGSGTVARTERIPLEERAEAAVIAWMRHQTTAYDNMHIPRVAGARREVRRLLARRSVQVLERYRKGSRILLSECPLQAALRAQT